MREFDDDDVGDDVDADWRWLTHCSALEVIHSWWRPEAQYSVPPQTPREVMMTKYGAALILNIWYTLGDFFL